MSGNARFHNKYHGANHHTVPTDGVVDSALDPIASHDYPFKGDMVVNGLLSACNNLTKVFSDPLDLDTIPYYSEPPTGWHVLRDSTFIDGHLTITGNVSATGKLTYFDTQVHVTSATEINVVADGSNRNSTAFLVNQLGNDDIVHFKDSGRSAFLITGHDSNNPGWIGINLNAITPDTPSQRVTIVGSISTVPDSNEIADQINGQADPGMSGSHYIEGQLHVNDKTFLDQTYIDTTDGNFVVSGSNTFDVDVLSDFEEHVTMDQVTIDTTEGNFLVNGSNTIHLSSQAGTEIHNYLDIHANDLNGIKGGIRIYSDDYQNDESETKFFVENTFVHLSGSRYFEGGYTKISTTDGSLTVSGSNSIDFDLDSGYAFNVSALTNLTDTYIDTSAHVGSTYEDRTFVVGPIDRVDDTNPGSGQAVFNTEVTFNSGVYVRDEAYFALDDVSELHVATGSRIYSEIPFFQNNTLTVDDTVSASGHVDFDASLDVDGFTSLDETHIDTTDGHFVVSGSNNVYIGTEEDAVDVFQKGDWTIESGDLYLENKLLHLQNDNTFIEFTPNIIDIQAGGKQVLRASQSLVDENEAAKLTIGDGESAIDVHFEDNVNIYFRNMLSGTDGWFESLTAENFYQVNTLSAYGDALVDDGDLTIKDGPDPYTTGSLYLCSGNIYLNDSSTVDGRDVSADGTLLDSVHTTTQTYSSNWQSVYSWVNTDSGTNNTEYNRTAFVNASGDSMTGDLNITGGLTATQDIKWDGGDSTTTNNVVTEFNTNSGNWDSTYTTVSSNSGNWDSAYTWVDTHGATSTRSYNDTRYVNVTGDTMTGTLNVPVVSAQSLSADSLTLSDDSLHFEGGGVIKGDADGNILIDSGTLRVTTLSALSSYVDVIDIKVRELSGYDIIDGDVSVDGDIEVVDISATGDITWNGGSSTGTNAVVTKVTSSSGNWDKVYTHMGTASGNWQDTYTHVQNASSAWTSPSDAIVSSSSANWDNTYTTYSTNSANYFNTTTNQIDGTLTVTGGISAYNGGVSATNMTVYELRGRPQPVYNSGGTEGVAFMVEGMEGVWSVFNGNYTLSGTNYNNRSTTYAGGDVYIHEEFSNLSHASSGILLVKGCVAGTENLNNRGSQLEWGFVQIAATKTEWITGSLPIETGGTAGKWTANHFQPGYSSTATGNINLAFGLSVDTYSHKVYQEIIDYFNTNYGITIPENSYTGTNNINSTLNKNSNAFRDDGDAISTGGWTTDEWTYLASFYTKDDGLTYKSGLNIGSKFIDTYEPGTTSTVNTTPELAVTAGNNHNYNPGTVKDRFSNFRITFDTISHYEDDIRLTPYTRLDGRDISVDGTYVDIVSAKHEDWTSTFTQVQSLSDGWNTGATIDTIMQSSSANWNSTYTTVSSNSASWSAAYTALTSTSGNWDSNYTTVRDNSGYWLDIRPGLTQTYEGDLLTVTNKISSAEVFVKSLTAEKTTHLDVTSGLTMPIGKNIYVRDGVLDVDGDIRVRDGDLKVSESIVHYLDENTEIRLEPDRMTFRCHDVRFLTINENDAVNEDYVSIGGEKNGNRIDFKMYASQIADPLVIDAHGETGLVTFGYSTILGTDSNDTVTFNADVNSNIVPDTPWFDNNTDPDIGTVVTSHTLGTASQAWSAIYVKDLQFRNTIRKDSSVSPLTATGDFIVVTVNGTERAIRLWDF